MSETSREPVKASPFLMRYFMWFAIGSLLLATVVGVLSVWMPYQREQQIARELESVGGKALFDFSGPSWIPMLIQKRLPFLKRISVVYLEHSEALDPGLVHLKELTSLRCLSLTNTQVTDAELEYLEGLTSLNLLALDEPRVTDAGLEHLKGLTSLHSLYLYNTQVTDVGLERLTGMRKLWALTLFNTQTTAEGRASLRKALPRCEIEPNP